MFIRNRRVYRVLEAWRKERTPHTYFSGCVQDVVSLIAQYVTPEVWPDKFQFQPIWEEVTKDDCGVRSHFLSDATAVIEEVDRRISLVDPQGRSRRGPQRVGPTVLLAADHQGGYWYEDWNFEPEGVDFKNNTDARLIFHHYHPTSCQPSRILQGYPGCHASDFIVTEDGTFYVLSDSPQRGRHQIIKYNSDGTMGPKYYGDFHLTRLSYKNGFLYLSGNGSLDWYKLDLLGDEDRIFHQALAPSLGRVVWPPPTSWAEQEKRKNQAPVDYWFDPRPDGFVLTQRDIYWLVDGKKHLLVTLPVDLVAEKLFVMANGEFRVIGHSQTSHNVYSIYRID